MQNRFGNINLYDIYLSELRNYLSHYQEIVINSNRLGLGHDMLSAESTARILFPPYLTFAAQQTNQNTPLKTFTVTHYSAKEGFLSKRKHFTKTAQGEKTALLNLGSQADKNQLYFFF